MWRQHCLPIYTCTRCAHAAHTHTQQTVYWLTLIKIVPLQSIIMLLYIVISDVYRQTTAIRSPGQQRECYFQWTAFALKSALQVASCTLSIELSLLNLGLSDDRWSCEVQKPHSTEGRQLRQYLATFWRDWGSLGKVKETTEGEGMLFPPDQKDDKGCQGSVMRVRYKLLPNSNK